MTIPGNQAKYEYVDQDQIEATPPKKQVSITAIFEKMEAQYIEILELKEQRFKKTAVDGYAGILGVAGVASLATTAALNPVAVASALGLTSAKVSTESLVLIGAGAGLVSGALIGVAVGGVLYLIYKRISRKSLQNGSYKKTINQFLKNEEYRKTSLEDLGLVK